MEETLIRFHVKLLVSLCVALVLASMLSPPRVSARTENASGSDAAQPTLQIVVATGDSTRRGFWAPALITISNGGPDFTGVLTVTPFTSRTPPPGHSTPAAWGGAASKPPPLSAACEKQ